MQRGNYDDPFCEALAEASQDPPPGESLPLLDPYHRVRHIPEDELPKCPECKTGLQRPGVVWFGEALDKDMIGKVDLWIASGKVVSLSDLTLPPTRFRPIIATSQSLQSVTRYLYSAAGPNVGYWHICPGVPGGRVH